jgi:hypothetical protein
MSCSLYFSIEYFNLKILLRYDGDDGLKVDNNYGKLLENLFFAEMSSDYFFNFWLYRLVFLELLSASLVSNL